MKERSSDRITAHEFADDVHQMRGSRPVMVSVSIDGVMVVQSKRVVHVHTIPDGDHAHIRIETTKAMT